MLLAAQRKGWTIHYMQQKDLYSAQGISRANMTVLEVRDDPQSWFTFGESSDKALTELDVILMRKDPPFDMEYVYTTYILERAELAGALIVNAPRALRDINEKAYTAWFPECTPLTMITRSMADMRAFLAEHGRIVVKPLDGMGGKSVFVIKKGDNNANVIFETLTADGSRFAMAQIFVAEIRQGDKRVLLINGDPVPFALARIPPADDNRGNLVMGAIGKGQPLSKSDRDICERVGPVLRDNGVIFAGIDIIGDYLTEVNVTSPTGIRELDREFDLNIAGQMFDAIDAELASRAD
jgi:glutathione synthase